MSRNSVYFQAFAQNEGSNHAKYHLLEQVRENSQFGYGNVTNEQFRAKYLSADCDDCNGWLGRKFTAVPNALLSLIKAVIHVAKAALFLIPSLLAGSRLVTNPVFSAVRDLQESFGHIVSLVNDQYGLYLVEKSQFNKSCYSFPSRSNIFSDVKLVGLNGIDYTTITENEFKDLLQAGSFLTRDRLENLTAENLRAAVGRLNDYHLRFLPDSGLDDLVYTSFTKERIKEIFPSETSTTAKLALLSKENLRAVVSKLRDYGLRYLPDSGLNDLVYTSFTKEQINEIFPSERPTTKDKLEKLTKENFQVVVSKLDDSVLRDLPNSRLNDIDYNILEKEQIEILFPYGTYFVKGVKIDLTKSKFARLTKENLRAVFSKLDDSRVRFLPNNRLNDLYYTSLTERQIRKLFPSDTSATAKLALLLQGKLRAVVSKLDGFILRYFPDSRLNDLDYEILSISQIGYLLDTRNIGLLSGDNLYRIFDGITGPHSLKYLINSIEPRQLKHSGLKEKYDRYKEAEKARKAEETSRKKSNSYSGNSYSTPSSRQEQNKADHAVLGLKPGADLNAVDKAYKKMALKVHPDKPGGKEEVFKELGVLYERIKATFSLT